MLELRLLGPVGASVDDAPIRLAAARQRTVLARLGLAAGEPVRVDRLIADLWGEDPPRSAGNAVQVLVSGLRSALGRDAVRTGVRTYRLSDAAIVDAPVFAAGVRRGLAASAGGDDAVALRGLEEALMLWRGTPLDGCEDVPFVEAERAALTDLYLAAAERHAAARLALGDPAGAIADLTLLVREHPFHEGLLAQLALALGAAGRQVDALAVVERARLGLAEQFGVAPGPQLRAAQERVLRGDLPMQHARPAPLRLGLAELPPPLAGRAAELAALEACAADPAVRLVTLLGLPGVGKTRLAEALVEAHPDRAARVSVAGVGHGDEVLRVVADRLGIGAGDPDPASALLNRFAGDERQLLLALDGAVPVPGLGAAIERMLRAVPALTVVVTSRVPLQLPAEHRLRLGGLAVRDDAGRPGPAVELVLERIRRLDVGVRPTPDDLEDAAAIAELCGGLPLALELAALRAAVLGLGEVRRRLAWSLEVLTGPHGVAGARTSMAEALLATVAALRPGTERALRGLAALPEPFPVDAALAAAAPDAATAAERVEELLDHGMLVASTADGRRCFALAPIMRRLLAPTLREPAAVG